MKTQRTSDGYAAFGPTMELKPWTFDLRPLGEDDIEIEIAYCGICHSDIHTINGEWGNQAWPIVPGHEIIGYVTMIGSRVAKFKVGDRAGVGPQGISCLKCSECKAHSETYCLTGFGGTYGHTFPDGFVTKGGYAKFHRVHNNFAMRIPDSLSSAEAAPLLCAGITCYSPFKYANVGPGSKVGVVGIGGLGHLGLQLAAALGAEVYALSTTESKRAEAIGFGAKDLLNTKNPDLLLKTHGRSFDMILNTASGMMNFKLLFELIKPHGNLTNVGLPEKDMQIPPLSFNRHITFTGTYAGPPAQIEEMLELCAKKKVTTKIEIAPLEKVNESLVRVAKGDARYRIVLAINEGLDQKNRPRSII